MSTTATTAAALPQKSEKHLTVELAGESYGLPLLKVREIIRLPKVTPVPQLPPHVKGVINLRGRVVPVVDLRAKFDLPEVNTERSCIVVVQINLSGRGDAPLGLIVDAVEEVVSLRGDEIAPPPEFGGGLRRDYILGIAKVHGGVKTLLDLDRALAVDPALSLCAA